MIYSLNVYISGEQLGLDRRTSSERLMSFLLAHHQKLPCTNWFVADNEADFMQHFMKLSCLQEGLY